MGVENEEIVVEVDVGVVDNRLPIVDLLPEIARGMAEEAERARADPNVSQEVETRFRAATRLAEQLALEVRSVRAMAPQSPLFTGRRPERPGRPGGPLGPPRPNRPNRPDRPDRPERPNRPDRPNRPSQD